MPHKGQHWVQAKGHSHTMRTGFVQWWKKEGSVTIVSILAGVLCLFGLVVVHCVAGGNNNTITPAPISSAHTPQKPTITALGSCKTHYTFSVSRLKPRSTYTVWITVALGMRAVYQYDGYTADESGGSVFDWDCSGLTKSDRPGRYILQVTDDLDHATNFADITVGTTVGNPNGRSSSPGVTIRYGASNCSTTDSGATYIKVTGMQPNSRLYSQLRPVATPFQNGSKSYIGGADARGKGLYSWPCNIMVDPKSHIPNMVRITDDGGHFAELDAPPEFD